MQILTFLKINYSPSKNGSRETRDWSSSFQAQPNDVDEGGINYYCQYSVQREHSWSDFALYLTETSYLPTPFNQEVVSVVLCAVVMRMMSFEGHPSRWMMSHFCAIPAVTLSL